MRSLFRERVFKKHYKNLIESRQGRTGKPTVNQISSVTILAAAKNHSLKDLEEAPKYFTEMGMTCYTYIVQDGKDVLEELTDFHIIKSDECLWYGVPSQEILIKWLAHKTDLLIVSNPGQDILIKYLCAASNSKLKSSFHTNGLQKKDMDIDLWVSNNGEEISLKEQCKLIYETLTQLGLKPPIIDNSL